VCSNIIFIDERLLPTSSLKSGYDLVCDIDEKDLPFVAMSIHFKAFLWTGDKHLYNGLVKKNYKRVITTTSLLKKLYR
jgi:predicted nucleic acid-binding protein